MAGGDDAAYRARLESIQPLLALEAVVFDTETTGLDLRRCRLVSIAAIGLSQGQARPEDGFSTLVDPGEPIPAAASAVHGIFDDDIAGAPSFAEAFNRFEDYRAGRLVIGHGVGFDLAVLKRESARAGLDWVRPRSLDTGLLTQIVGPRLPDFALDTVAAWLGIDVQGRHTAQGDAAATAAIFLALLPHLRARSIRSLAEAEAACRSLAEALEGQSRAGWEEPMPPAGPDSRALPRIDSFPYRHRIGEVMSSPPAMAPPSLTLAEATAEMARRRISSLFVTDLDAGPGIVTERDVLRAVAARGAAALDERLGALASRPLATVSAGDHVHRAIGRMDRLRLRHLGVTDENGRLAGAVSARDLLRLRAGQAIALGDAVEAADGASALAAAFARLPVAAAALLREEVDPRDIASVTAGEIAAMTRRCGELALSDMAADGEGEAPTDFALVILGSAGRGESLLAPDQDNALVFADTEHEGEADLWFGRFGERLNAKLDAAGIPLCRGGIMVRNAAWRGSAAEWRRRIGGWMQRSAPQDLLHVDMVFDMRPVLGNASLARTVWRESFAAAERHPAFVKLLAETAGDLSPPLGLFGRIRTENGQVDLKSGGLFPIVAAVRVLALRHGIAALTTADRIEGLRAGGIGSAEDWNDLADAHRLIVGLVLDQQIADIEAGVPPSNRVTLSRLDGRETARLKRALGRLRHVQAMLRDFLF